MKYSEELRVAKKASEEAAKIIRSYASKNSFDIDLKGKNDLVTDADIASEKKIIEIIKKAFPEDQFLAEESSTRNSLTEERTWIIDPIDGTTNFAHGFPIYCVSIALWENKKPKVGLVLEVANNELFYAVKGEGAFLNEEEITVSNQKDSSRALIATGFPYTAFDHIDEYLALLRFLMKNTHGIRRPGAASYDLCCVACGIFDGFFESGLSAWDVGAGALIIKESGGTVTDWYEGENWLFGKRIIAGNKQMVGFLQKQISEHFNQS